MWFSAFLVIAEWGLLFMSSWNSGYRWLRKKIRRRLGQTSPDPVGAAIDDRLGVLCENGVLRLEPGRRP